MLTRCHLYVQARIRRYSRKLLRSVAKGFKLKISNCAEVIRSFKIEVARSSYLFLRDLYYNCTTIPVFYCRRKTKDHDDAGVQADWQLTQKVVKPWPPCKTRDHDVGNWTTSWSAAQLEKYVTKRSNIL